MTLSTALAWELYKLIPAASSDTAIVLALALGLNAFGVLVLLAMTTEPKRLPRHRAETAPLLDRWRVIRFNAAVLASSAYCDARRVVRRG